MTENPPIRLAFIGASGTGKTTLATRIADRLGLPICPVGSRSVSKAMGFENPYDVDAAGKRSEFQQLLLHHKEEWELKHLDGFVTDRSHLDNLAYTMEHAPALGRDGSFRADVNIAMNRYTHIVICPISSWFKPGDDPARVNDREYHLRWEATVMGMLGEFVFGAPVLILTSSVPDTRLDQVRRFIRP